MQNILIFFASLALKIQLGLSECLIRDDTPNMIYPSLNSSYILNVNEHFHDSNLQFDIQDEYNSTLNTTYYSSTANLVQQINLYGKIISSNQYVQDTQSQTQRATGIIALLVQNSTGYFVFQVTQSNNNYNVTFIGNGITVQIMCYQILYRTQNILFVSCLNQAQTQAIMYQYDLTEQSMQPTLFYDNVSLSNTNKNFICNYFIQDYTLQSYYVSSQHNTTVQYIVFDQGYTSRPYTFDGQLMDVMMLNTSQQFLLFSNNLNYDQISQFSLNDTSFLKFSIFGFDIYYVYIVTLNNILLVKVKENGQMTLIDQIDYQTQFYLDVNSIVQIFTDNQYIIVSNSTMFLVYQQINHKLFWKYQLQQQSLIQYDDLNKIITIISQFTIQAFQLFQPKILLYFDQLSSGKLLLSLYGNNINCSIQFNYKVLSVSDPGPYPNQFDSQQNVNFQESQIQCVSCLFTGQNLTYSQQSININHQYYQYEINNQFTEQDFHFFYIYSHEINAEQYLIFYQLQNDYNLFLIYCGLPYCLQQEDFQTKNSTPFTQLPGYISQLYVQYDQQFYNQSFTLIFNLIDNTTDYYYECQFKWFQPSNKCYQYNVLQIQQQTPPLSKIESIFQIGYNIYISFSNPYSIYFLNGSDYGLIYQNYQFVPRAVYVNKIYYNNFLFIDNVFQLNIYELIVNGTQLNLVTQILYPIKQGNTSVGIGLLEKSIVITQIDDQGNQYILFYDSLILRPITLIQQPQPQTIQIPRGAQIQFPIVCSYTNSKFYLVWQYNQNSEIAVFQPSASINNVLLTSIYIDGQINSIQSISQVIYDQVICQFNQAKILQITVWNQFFIQLSSNLLLQNETLSNISIIYQAQSSLSQDLIINQYTFINGLFNLTQINQYLEMELNNTFQFKLLINQYYYGLAHNFQSPQNVVIRPIINSNLQIDNIPVPSLFLSVYYQNPWNHQFDSIYQYFSNNSGLYQLFELGNVKQIVKFAPNLTCPVLALLDGTIVSVCQQITPWGNELSFYYFYLGYLQLYQYFLNQELTLINGVSGNNDQMILNFGQTLQIFSQYYENIIWEYTNYDINITNVFILEYQDQIVVILQLQEQNEFMTLNYQQYQGFYDQHRIIIDSSFGNVVDLDFQLRNEYDYDNQYLVLTVTTTKMVIIYLLNPSIFKTYIVNYQSDFVGIQTQIINDYIIAIYNTTLNNQLNYTVVLYQANLSNFTKYPIAYFNDFYGEPQQFYIQSDGTLIYTYTYQNKSGFSYIQIIPYIYIGLNYQNIQTYKVNESYEQVFYYPQQLTISNQFNSINILLNITVNQYLGEKYINQNILGHTEQALIIILLIILIAFIVFVIFKMMTKNKME